MLKWASGARWLSHVLSFQSNWSALCRLWRVAGAEALVPDTDGPVASGVLGRGVSQVALLTGSSSVLNSWHGPSVLSRHVGAARLRISSGLFQGLVHLGVHARHERVGLALITLHALGFAGLVAVVLLVSQVPRRSEGARLESGGLGDLINDLGGDSVLRAESLRALVDEVLFDGVWVSDHTVAV